MGYPKDILSTRSKIEVGKYAVIPPEGLVKNVVPGMDACKVSILASPKLGAGFAKYLIRLEGKATKNQISDAKKDVEQFLYCLSGEGECVVDGTRKNLSKGVYVYASVNEAIEFNDKDNSELKLLLYKQKYVSLEGEPIPPVVWGNTEEIMYKNYDSMENVQIKDLLPVDLRFDMNMHILSFQPGGCHPFVETHVQEHGAYVLEGEGMYLLDNEWMPIKKDDFIWFGPYVTQGAYGVGLNRFTYIYSKDCNRDVEL
ncbi:(S)-ureidoglycine aminohydrolase [Anaerosacchariphilus polymeriproducens]|uniref:Cupin domain-containing protein n=1 Tax=Anaerosacchariphilus polymeriproducens TaxID=1812858 RepID=A0A371AX84_9FIRM|nr:(S)-ureidoglycine aminohydrolase [Anaerosacchariphilus polymeriproducens]RDU24090.1 cupin domain-containing protein [Anaerosacchariphilus polymeriproducens]